MTFGDFLNVSFCEGADPIHNGVQILSYAEAGDTIGLAHGEAIKLFSLFYNLEVEGNELFDEIEVNAGGSGFACSRRYAAVGDIVCSMDGATNPSPISA